MVLGITDRKGKIIRENSAQDRFLDKMYGHAAGRVLLMPLITPAFSKIGGKLLDSKISRIFIPLFIRSHSIDMREYEQKKYQSYNDFFTRKMMLFARKIEWDPNIFISPCDGRLSVCRISKKSIFKIKHSKYTVKSLLKNSKLAEAYAGGYIWIFRLRVDDYHRYVYTDSGSVCANVKIPGIFHTVNPVANEYFPIYKENAREYSLIKSDHFGMIIQMEVGALLVGKIENRHNVKAIKRGQERGNFAFGGSTIILMTKQGEVLPDKDILKNTMRGIETKIKLGERVGVKE